MTPSDIEVLIHCYVSPDPHPRRQAPAVQEAFKKFLNAGIIQSLDSDSGMELTDRGRAWLKVILATPYPKQAWVDSNGKVIP